MPRPTTPRRGNQAAAYLSDEDLARLDRVAAARGTTRSEVVRQMVRQGLVAAAQSPREPDGLGGAA